MLLLVTASQPTQEPQAQAPQEMSRPRIRRGSIGSGCDLMIGLVVETKVENGLDIMLKLSR